MAIRTISSSISSPIGGLPGGRRADDPSNLRATSLREAEQAARKFLARFPDVYDGYDLLGMVYEARGDNKKAADCYRKAIDFIREHPD